MLSFARWRSSRRCWLFGVAVLGFFASSGSGAPSATDGDRSTATSTVLLTNLPQIWRLAENEQNVRHPVRLEYVVYYYDPLWSALWGRCGDEDSYLSIGSRVFPIKPHQKILVEGWMVPSRGMTVDEPKITVLADSVPVEVVTARGQIGNVERLNKRMVALEAYVDRQTARDANHLDLGLVVEGRAVSAMVLLKSDAPVLALKGSMLRLSGVYFARPDAAPPRLELWVPGMENVEVLGTLDRDTRFDLPATSIAKLADASATGMVRIVGTMRGQVLGRSLTVRDSSGELILNAAQTNPLEFDAPVEVIGIPTPAGSSWTLSEALYRPAQKELTAIEQVYRVPDTEAQEVHRVRLEIVVYYYDAVWKVMWGRNGTSDNYLSLVGGPPELRPGQRVLVVGSVVPARGMVVENPRVSVLADSVPLSPLSADSDVGDIEKFNKHLVTLEGYVDRQAQTDPNHVEFDLLADDRVVAVHMLTREHAPQLEGALLRAKGVYSATTDPAGGPPKLELWVQGEEDLSIRGQLDRDERFNVPATPIEKLADLPAGRLARIAGTIRAQQPGASLTVRDDTGQISVRSAQTSRLALGENVEVIGVPSRQGAEWVLVHGFYRRARSLAGTVADPARLRLAEQLRDLTVDEASRARPVQLTGVVTWTHRDADFFYLRDVSGGAYVVQPPGNPAPLLVGLKVEVAGVSGIGAFAPIVLASSVKYTARMDLPEARPVTLEQAMTGVEEGQWVSMVGYVRSVEQEGRWARLNLTTSAGEFAALLPPAGQIGQLGGSVVRVRGVCAAIANRRRQLTGIQLWVPSINYVEVDDPAPTDPYTVPIHSVASLRQYGTLSGSYRRVRLAGVVLNQAPGRSIHLQEGTDGLLVLSAGTELVRPGDRIEAVGFPGRESNRVVLREAVYRKTGVGAEPIPLSVADVAAINPEYDGRLVQVPALLLELGAQEKGSRLVLQAGRIFEAAIDLPRALAPAEWKPGSRVALTGVYQIQFDESKRPHSVVLLLRTPGDVRVIDRPSWWTVQRALALTAVLALCVVMGLGWVAALRRRVQQQTAQIREQHEKERAARLEAALARASKLESLGILAGGIAHDFNNLLTVVMCNLSLARLDTRASPETLRCLREGERATTRARDLTQQLLTFAKGGAPVRASTMLTDVVRESAEFALHGAKAKCEFDLAPDLWPANVDRGQVGQVVQNIVINANQAMPEGGLIRIGLKNADVAAGTGPGLAPGRYLKLTISDNGSGIPPEQLPRIFDPYFTTKPQGSGLGLATVYSIVKQHQGQVEVDSAVGRGSTFTVWLPAAAAAPAPASVAKKTLPRLQGRVLFMDDEASIRQMAATVLRRMGLEVTDVAEGAAVIREYNAALAQGRRYDLLILDLTVPGGMGGAEAMQQLRKIDPHVRAIVSSGYSSDPVMSEYQRYGFAAVVSKPYEAPDLARAIETVLARGDSAADASPKPVATA